MYAIITYQTVTIFTLIGGTNRSLSLVVLALSLVSRGGTGMI